MKVALISFTEAGAKICRKIEDGLKSKGWDCSAYGKEPYAEAAGVRPIKGSLDEWTADTFSRNDALVFVGASGIAVRAIAPHIRNKTVDPAVTVVDEKGKHAISLLSGHLGGANEITREIAAIIGAVPVITTATDLNQRFAVDDWAKQNRLQIGDMTLAKEISAAILRGETVGVFSEFPIEGEPPDGLRYLSKGEEPGERPGIGETAPAAGRLRIGFRVSVHEEDGPFEKTLHLIPPTVTVGIGCRKGVSLEAAGELLYKVLKENRLSVKSIEKICTIDIKKEEPALKQLAEKLGVPLQAFSAEELKQAPGEFISSEFVNRITGVDNICERTAVLGSQGELLAGKQALNGVTAAIAVRKDVYKWKQK